MRTSAPISTGARPWVDLSQVCVTDPQIVFELPAKSFPINDPDPARSVLNRKRMRASLHILASLVLISSASATTLLKMSMNDLILQSTSIVRAKVSGSRSVSVGRGDIYTYYQLQISATLKVTGILPAEVAVSGGVYGNVRQIGIGSPALAEGQDYVLFLWTGRSGMTQVIGLSQGLFSLTQDASGDTVLTRPAIADQMLDKAGKQVTDTTLTMKWSDLRALILKNLPKAKQ